MFARISVPVHATNCTLLSLMETPKKVIFVVRRYVVRKANIGRYAVRRLKIKQNARGEGGFTHI